MTAGLRLDTAAILHSFPITLTTGTRMRSVSLTLLPIALDTTEVVGVQQTEFGVVVQAKLRVVVHARRERATPARMRTTTVSVLAPRCASMVALTTNVGVTTTSMRGQTGSMLSVRGRQHCGVDISMFTAQCCSTPL